MRAVPSGLLTRRKQNELSLLHSLDQLLCKAQLWRIDRIVRRINKHHWDFDLIELGEGIVVARGVEGIPGVVRVQVLRSTFLGSIERRIGLIAGGILVIKIEWSAPDQQHQADSSAHGSR